MGCSDGRLSVIDFAACLGGQDMRQSSNYHSFPPFPHQPIPFQRIFARATTRPALKHYTSKKRVRTVDRGYVWPRTYRRASVSLIALYRMKGLLWTVVGLILFLSQQQEVMVLLERMLDGLICGFYCVQVDLRLPSRHLIRSHSLPTLMLVFTLNPRLDLLLILFTLALLTR